MRTNLIYTFVSALLFVFCTQQVHAQADAGKMAPDFTLKTLNGQEITLSQFKGKYVLIDFWGSWCGPCRKSSPMMVELYGHLQAQKANIEFIGIACNERNDAMWQKAIKDDKLAWTQVKIDQNVGAKYKIAGVPTCILVSPEGKILYREHPVSLIPKVKKLFGIDYKI
ncbi:MAG: TlpA family protein disulfide reductase [Prevotellaceae bacterium]|jgi:thiol-disulfide isomerase/thioredoxin|nr:TlpA family protein disulfide reductase [Prevotellaceae bacterium]